jgi:hypothetical protein
MVDMVVLLLLNRLIADLSDDSQVYGCGARRSFESPISAAHSRSGQTRDEP